ncbi:MerR family transcriptional regulator [Streptococcus anginosus]|uniref:MerR family transcriptional regulator n=1 Tax=Streptococcus anginosus TaxID=1328 RepID=UPI003081E3C1
MRRWCIILRSEIQNKTGLTRKAIKYYEEKGLSKPLKLENGYRDYSEEDMKILSKISLFRKVGLSISEIKECLSSNGNSLSSILRRKQHQLDIEQKRLLS